MVVSPASDRREGRPGPNSHRSRSVTDSTIGLSSPCLLTPSVCVLLFKVSGHLRSACCVPSVPYSLLLLCCLLPFSSFSVSFIVQWVLTWRQLYSKFHGKSWEHNTEACPNPRLPRPLLFLNKPAILKVNSILHLILFLLRYLVFLYCKRYPFKISFPVYCRYMYIYFYLDSASSCFSKFMISKLSCT